MLTGSTAQGSRSEFAGPQSPGYNRGVSTLRAVYTNLMAARTTIRDVRRFRQIAAVLMRHGFGFLFSRLSKKDPEVARAVDEARMQAEGGEIPPGPPATGVLAKRLRRAIEDLGPTFIKFGQILSTRPDLIPKEICDELQGLQDDVDAMSLDDVRKVFAEELGAAPGDIFAEFEETPIAAASVAQVHRAKLKSGEEVAVKIQRPGIGKTIEADLDILYFLAKQTVEAVPETRLFDPVGIVREFERAIRKELDFSQEGRNIEKFARNFKDVDYVHIPTIYKEHSGSRILVMEFIRGTKITDAVEQGLADGDVIAKRALAALFKQFFQDGFFHGDLHPGNILVLPENRICYLDFGLVGRLTPDMKDRIIDMLFAVGRQDFDALGRVLYEMGVREGPVDYDAFMADVYEVAERYFEDTPLAEIDVGGLFQELVQGAMRHQMRMPTAYTMSTKAMMTVEGLGKRIAPDMDLVEEVQPFIQELLKERYSPERLWKKTTDAMYGLSRMMRQVPPALTRVLEDIDHGRLTLRIDDARMDDLLADRRRSDKMRALAFSWGVFIVSGVLALPYDEHRLLGLPAVSLVAWLLAFVPGTLYLYGWWKR
jgi:ubiquinone biosynthesis protein